MPEHFRAPETSKEVIDEVYQQFRGNIKGFASELAPQIGKDQPEFLDANLQGATSIMLHEGPLPAVLILAGNFFRYECTNRQMQSTAETLPLIGRETFVNSLERFANLRDLTVGFGRADVMLRRIAIQLANEDPTIGELVNDLLMLPVEVQQGQAMDAFIQGIHMTHVQLNNIDSTPSPEPIVSEGSKLPSINRPLVRQALLSAIYDPESFTGNTMDFLGTTVPDMADRIHSIGSKDYQLLATFTSFCIIGEIQARNLQLTVIDGKKLSHPNPTISKLLAKNTLTTNEARKIEKLLQSFNVETLDEIRNTNPNLYWGVMSFLNPLSKLDPKRLSAGMNGVVHQYNTLNAILRIK